MSAVPATAPLLADEHEVLLHEVGARTDRLLETLAGGEWPAQEMRALLDYLRYEVLDQATHEERLLYPLVRRGFADQRVRRLLDEHVQLRDAADALAAEATAPAGRRHPDRLASVLTDLTAALRRHLREEQEVLAAVTPAGITSLRRSPHRHEWFPMTEGALLDLDHLPADGATAAVVDRLTRLRPGEGVELRSTAPLGAVETALRRHGTTADLGWIYREEGPSQWRARIVRRR